MFENPLCASSALRFRSAPAGGGKAAPALKYTRSSRTRHASFSFRPDQQRLRGWGLLSARLSNSDVFSLLIPPHVCVNVYMRCLCSWMERLKRVLWCIYTRLCGLKLSVVMECHGRFCHVCERNSWQRNTLKHHHSTCRLFTSTCLRYSVNTGPVRVSITQLICDML